MKIRKNFFFQKIINDVINDAMTNEAKFSIVIVILLHLFITAHIPINTAFSKIKLQFAVTSLKR